MRLTTLLSALLTTTTAVRACKSVHTSDASNVDIGCTRFACEYLGGRFQFGNDCAANSISGKLSAFADICNECTGSPLFVSDCDFP